MIYHQSDKERHSVVVVEVSKSSDVNLYWFRWVSSFSLEVPEALFLIFNSVKGETETPSPSPFLPLPFSLSTPSQDSQPEEKCSDVDTERTEQQLKTISISRLNFLLHMHFSG